MTTETEALTYDHIVALALEHGFKLKPQVDGRMALNDYVIDFARAVYDIGRADAKAEIAAAGEPVAWCIPNDPCNATAFAWPGTDRTPQHNVPLVTADQLAAAVAAERGKCAGIVNELRMECARRNMPESATMLWHAEDAIRAGAKETGNG